MLNFSKFDELFRLILRCFLGIVFLISGISKIIEPEKFLEQIGKLNFLVSSIDSFIVYIFITYELLLGGLILFKSNKGLMNFVVITLSVFCLYLGYKIIIQDNSDCGCFGSFIYRDNLSALTQDLFLLIIGIYVYEKK